MHGGVKRILAKLSLAAVLLASPGCFGENPAQMLETAKFEELQRNEPHAREIYQRLIASFPDRPEAAEARRRLAALDAGAAQTGSE